MATEKELKYSFTAHHGGAAKWHFLPYISCGQVIAVQKLKALVHAVIVQYPNSLNRLSHSRSLAKSVADDQREAHLHGEAHLHDQNTGDRDVGNRGNDDSVHIKVWGAGADDSSLQ